MQELPMSMASIGIGERLRSARQALGLSLEEIESITHIRRSYLDALEREAFDALPGPTYTRGFLRAYAGCLGLPPQDLLDQFPAAAREVPQRDSSVEVRLTPAVRLSPVRRAMMGVGLLVGLGVLFIGVVLYMQLREFASTAPAGAPSARGGAPRSSAPPSTTAQPGAASPTVAPKPAASPAPPASHAPAAPPAPPAAARPGSPAAPTQPSPAQPVAPPPAPAAPGTVAPPPGPAGSMPSAPAAVPGTPPAPSAVASPAAPLNVTIAASGYTWVRGVADGATVFEGFMNAGDKQTWQAKHSLTVRVGNAAAMSISVNGKPVGPLGNAGQVYEHTFAAGAP